MAGVAAGVGAAASAYQAYKASRPKPGPMGGMGGGPSATMVQPSTLDKVIGGIGTAGTLADALNRPQNTPDQPAVAPVVRNSPLTGGVQPTPPTGVNSLADTYNIWNGLPPEKRKFYMP